MNTFVFVGIPLLRDDPVQGRALRHANTHLVGEVHRRKDGVSLDPNRVTGRAEVGVAAVLVGCASGIAVGGVTERRRGGRHAWVHGNADVADEVVRAFIDERRSARGLIELEEQLGAGVGADVALVRRREVRGVARASADADPVEVAQKGGACGRGNVARAVAEHSDRHPGVRPVSVAANQDLRFDETPIDIDVDVGPAVHVSEMQPLIRCEPRDRSTERSSRIVWGASSHKVTAIRGEANRLVFV